MSDDNPIVCIPFHGDELYTLDVNGKPHIVLKPVIEGIGLDYWPQIERLRKHSWAALAKRQVQVSDQQQRREMIVCDTRTFLMWLATVDENRVAKDVRSRLEAYQSEVADVIQAYWTKGGAVNPRATEEQLTAIIERSERQMRVLRLAEGLADPRWLESKIRHVAARALGEEPEEDHSSRPITVGEYLNDRGVTATAARKLAPTFGKRLKALYLSRHGEPPGTARRFVDGAQRDVAVYTEADRPLFDAVWSDLTDDAAA